MAKFSSNPIAVMQRIAGHLPQMPPELALGYFSPDFVPFFDAHRNEPVLQSVLQGLENFCKSVARGAKLGNGYSIVCERDFQWMGTRFDGLYLTLKGPGGKRIGSMEFHIGFPLRILGVQGYKGDAPRQLFRLTRKHFDQHLLDFFFSRAAVHLPGRPGRGFNRAVFVESALRKMPLGMRRRVANSYLPQGPLKEVLRRGRADVKPVPVRSSVFKRVRRQAAKRRCPK
jgi:hypothetical protein